MRRLLATAQESRPGVETGMAFVGRVDPEGRRIGLVCRIGSWDGARAEGPPREVEVAPFLVDRREVTCAEYKAFCDTTGTRYPPSWTDGRIPAGQEDRPVSEVTQAEAAAYARHAGKSLPTATQWEAAARGEDGRTYPWGDELGTEASDVSPFGVRDLAGSVAEWTRTCDWDVEGGDGWIVKGAAAPESGFYLRAAAVRTFRASERRPGLGFRCVLDLGE